MAEITFEAETVRVEQGELVDVERGGIRPGKKDPVSSRRYLTAGIPH